MKIEKKEKKREIWGKKKKTDGLLPRISSSWAY